MLPRTLVSPLTLPATGFEDLRAEAARDDFRFVDRLVEEWRSGANRFDRPGETLLGAWQDGCLVGLGGLNRDPYRPESGVGRLRHLFVIGRLRRSGVGSLLVERLVDEARRSFGRLRLRTGTPAAAAFYRARGFDPTDEEGATHMRALGRDRPRVDDPLPRP